MLNPAVLIDPVSYTHLMSPKRVNHIRETWNEAYRKYFGSGATKSMTESAAPLSLIHIFLIPYPGYGIEADNAPVHCLVHQHVQPEKAMVHVAVDTSPVSYTHLDVYKRQGIIFIYGCRYIAYSFIEHAVEVETCTYKTIIAYLIVNS